LISISVFHKKLETINVDGYCYVVISKKSSKGIVIYNGYNFVQITNKKIVKNTSFVCFKNNFFAHGETIKKAIEDLNFKIVSEKLKNNPIDRDTIISLNHYRLITGACELGCKSWMEENNITTDKIKASDLLPILEKTNAYGLSNFKRLITF
jgi:hypothetical protein